jgi:hypothetical protein
MLNLLSSQNMCVVATSGPGGPLVVVEAERIVYTEHWLRREGFAPRQVWRREPDVMRETV